MKTVLTPFDHRESDCLHCAIMKAIADYAQQYPADLPADASAAAAQQAKDDNLIVRGTVSGVAVMNAIADVISSFIAPLPIETRASAITIIDDRLALLFPNNIN